MVRIQARPPADLEQREYWARLIVTSSQVRDPVAGADTVSRMGLDFVFRNVLSVNYRNGAVRTDLQFDSLWVGAAAEDAAADGAVRRGGG